ncbi:MAG: hypothetical protein AAF992_26320 [Bacteroidota bacterium]
MKKLFFTSVAFTIFSLSSLAQENPYLVTGRSFVGGGLSLVISENEEPGTDFITGRSTKDNLFGISPTYGKLFNERWAAGVRVGLRFGNNSNTFIGNGFTNESVRTSTNISITPFLRRFFPISDRFGGYLQPELSYAYERANSEETFQDANSPINDRMQTFESNGHTGRVGAQGGLYYFVTPHFLVETSLLRLDISYGTTDRRRTDSNARPEDNTQLTRTDIRLNLVNQLSFDQILTLYYYF